MKAHALLPSLLFSLLPLLAIGCADDASDATIRVELRGGTAQAWELTGPAALAPDVAAALADQLGADDAMAPADTTVAITIDEDTVEVSLDAAVAPAEIEAIAADHGFTATPATLAEAGKADGWALPGNRGRIARAEVANYSNTNRDSFASFEPSTSTWAIDHFDGERWNRLTRQWGVANDRPVLGDYDNDGKTDVAVWRPSDGRWYVWTMKGVKRPSFQHGVATDVPVPGDYDGDKITDYAVYRASTSEWRIMLSTTGDRTMRIVVLPAAGAQLVPGDYDGDGKTDVAIFRAGTWTWRPSRGGADVSKQLGIGSDTARPADYDNDGKTDPGVFSSYGEWQVLESSRSYGLGPVSVFGYASDTPTAGDHDGDGRMDYDVWRPSDGYFYALPVNGLWFKRKVGNAFAIAVAGPYRYAAPAQL